MTRESPLYILKPGSLIAGKYRILEEIGGGKRFYLSLSRHLSRSVHGVKRFERRVDARKEESAL